MADLAPTAPQGSAPSSIVQRPLPEPEPLDVLYARALAVAIATNTRGGAFGLDRKVPVTWLIGAAVAVVLTFAGYGYTAVTWINATNTAVKEITREVSRLAVAVEAGDKRILDRGDERFRAVSDRLGALERERDGTSNRLTRLEEQFRWVQDAFARIEKKLDAPRR